MYTTTSSSNGRNTVIKNHQTPITSTSNHHYERTISFNRTSIKRTVTTRKTYVVIVGFRFSIIGKKMIKKNCIFKRKIYFI
jgi:hypothetical protein